MNHLEEIIHKSMGSRWADVPVQALSETDSTNTRLKEWAREGRIAAPYVLTADSQTAGRGRLGRRFVSPPGTGLYMSILIAPPKNTDAGKITVLAAVAVCRTIHELTGLQPKIKWVNDLFLRGKKVCGILAEKINEGVIVGIGINVESPPGGFPPEAGRHRAKPGQRPFMNVSRISVQEIHMGGNRAETGVYARSNPRYLVPWNESRPRSFSASMPYSESFTFSSSRRPLSSISNVAKYRV